MIRGKVLLCGAAAVVIVTQAASVWAAETTTYTYDALGRLVTAEVAGGFNAGKVTATCFDPAGNRTTYKVANSAPACAAMPTNAAPVANADTFSAACYQTGSANLIANDVDPNGAPLTLQSISKIEGDATAEVTSGSTVEVETGDAGGSTFSYVVADANGDTATGTLTVSATEPTAGCDAVEPQESSGNADAPATDGATPSTGGAGR